MKQEMQQERIVRIQGLYRGCERWRIRLRNTLLKPRDLIEDFLKEVSTECGEIGSEMRLTASQPTILHGTDLS